MFVMLLCVGGLTAAIVLNSLLQLIFWMREFLFILTGAVLLMIIQISVYQPVDLIESVKDNLFYTFIQLSGMIMAWGYLSLIGIWRENRLNIIQYSIISGWTILIVVAVVLRWTNYNFDVFAYMPTLGVIIPSVLIIIKARELKRKEFGSFLVLFSALSIIGYAFEFLESFARMSEHPVINSQPTGFFSFTGFSLILALSALIFCLKTIGALRGQLKGNAPTEQQVKTFCSIHELTNRESQIVGKLLLRYTHNEIAEQLNISPRTVERHVYNMYQKTGMSSRFELYDLIRTEPVEN